MMSEDWYKVTVRVTLDVEVGVGCIGEDTLGDIRSAVEEVAGAAAVWLDEAEAGMHGDREFRAAWRHAHRGQPQQVGDPCWQSVDIVDVTVTTIDS